MHPYIKEGKYPASVADDAAAKKALEDALASTTVLLTPHGKGGAG